MRACPGLWRTISLQWQGHISSWWLAHSLWVRSASPHPASAMLVLFSLQCSTSFVRHCAPHYVEALGLAKQVTSQQVDTWYLGLFVLQHWRA